MTLEEIAVALAPSLTSKFDFSDSAKWGNPGDKPHLAQWVALCFDAAVEFKAEAARRTPIVVPDFPEVKS